MRDIEIQIHVGIEVVSAFQKIGVLGETYTSGEKDSVMQAVVMAATRQKFETSNCFLCDVWAFALFDIELQVCLEH